MRKIIALSLFLLTAILSLSSTVSSQNLDSCPVQWVSASYGGIPYGAVVCGHESDGTPLYLARAYYNGGLHPGKVRSEFGSANIAYGDDEVKVNPYDVYCGGGMWVSASGGAVPAGAVICGYDTNGEPLYAARAYYAGGLQIGKVRPAFAGADITYGGYEYTVNSYEVLCCAWDYPTYPSRPTLHVG
ncbi:MAG: DUF3421 domain-containing protein [Methanothrix sp.]